MTGLLDKMASIMIGVGWDGMAWDWEGNGMAWDGLEWNGMDWNGMDKFLQELVINKVKNKS